jgi:hypothetical protein
MGESSIILLQLGNYNKDKKGDVEKDYRTDNMLITILWIGIHRCSVDALITHQLSQHFIVSIAIIGSSFNGAIVETLLFSQWGSLTWLPLCLQ